MQCQYQITDQSSTGSCLKMIVRGIGESIVNVSSLAAQRFPHGALYGPSKACLELLTKTMAAGLGHHKIRVNAVSPTPTKTEDMQKAMGGATEGARVWSTNIHWDV